MSTLKIVSLKFLSTRHQRIVFFHFAKTYVPSEAANICSETSLTISNDTFETEMMRNQKLLGNYHFNSVMDQTKFNKLINMKFNDK